MCNVFSIDFALEKAFINSNLFSIFLQQILQGGKDCDSLTLRNSVMKCSLIIWGHSESTFVEEGRGHWKANKNEQEEVEGPNMSVRSLFLKKMLGFQNDVYRYSPVFPIDYNAV